MIKITNEDNMELMKRYPDDYFLTFIDPPFGIKAARPTKKPTRIKQKNGTYLNVKTIQHEHKSWDDKPADSKFGKEILRVGRNHCVWGANYFDWLVDKTFETPKRKEYSKFIKDNPKGWIIWDKVNGDCDQMDCELLKTSFDFDTFIIKYMWSGMMQGSISNGEIMEGNKKLNEKRFHPCHKPIRIYDKIFSFLKENGFINENTIILETNLGAGSIALSCINNSLDLIACDIEVKYCDISKERVKLHKQQQRLF